MIRSRSISRGEAVPRRNQTTERPRVDAEVTSRSAETAELLQTVSSLKEDFFRSIARAAETFWEVFERRGKVLVCGNGGSAAEAQHFSDEMLGRYKENRRSYPVIALTADSATLTCIGNDFGFSEVFARQVQGLGVPGDALLAISTSGNSPNVLRAVRAATKGGLRVVALTAKSGKLRELADVSIEAPSAITARIQEIHLHAIHLLSEYFEPSGRYHPS